MREICAYFTKSLCNINASHPEPQSVEVEDLRELYDSTLYIGEKEASGRVVLGMFMNKVQKVLAKKYHKACINNDHEFRVLGNKTYACDEAVTSIAQIDPYTRETKCYLQLNTSQKCQHFWGISQLGTSLNCSSRHIISGSDLSMTFGIV